MYRGFVRGCFAYPLGVHNALYAKIMGLILSVELAKVKGWYPLRIEIDSEELVKKIAVRSNDVPWRLRL